MFLGLKTKLTNLTFISDLPHRTVSTTEPNRSNFPPEVVSEYTRIENERANYEHAQSQTQHSSGRRPDVLHNPTMPSGRIFPVFLA